MIYIGILRGGLHKGGWNIELDIFIQSNSPHPRICLDIFVMFKWFLL